MMRPSGEGDQQGRHPADEQYEAALPVEREVFANVHDASPCERMQHDHKRRTKQEQVFLSNAPQDGPVPWYAWQSARSVPHGAAATANAAVLTLTLGFGAVAMALLVTAAEGQGSRAGAASGLIYGVTLEASAVCSFLYNLLPGGVRRPILRYLDHTAIFLLIAGTYTPLAVRGLPQPFGYRLLAVVWGLTLLGVLLKLFLDARYDRLFVPFYLGIGLSVLVGFQDLIRTMPGPAVSLVALGGAAYIAGAVVFLRDQGPWTDAIWHVLVLAGAIAHFAAIYIVLG